METTIIFYTNLIVSVAYFLFFTSMMFDFTRGSRRANVAQILFFMFIHSFMGCFTIYENDISILQRYAVFMTLTKEMTIAFIYNFVLSTTSKYKNFLQLWKHRHIYTLVPLILPITIAVVFLLLGFDHFVAVPENFPIYSIHGYENLFLNFSFRLYNRLFLVFTFSAILLSVFNSSKKKILNRTTTLISAASIFYVSLVLFQEFSASGASLSAEEQYIPAMLRTLLGFFVMSIFILIFIYDGQELLSQGLKRNMIDSFGVPVFLFSPNLEFCYANNEGEAFIKKYELKADSGTKLNDFFALQHFNFIALPQKKDDSETHYIISLIDEITYTVKRTPLYTRFNNICGYSVIVSEYENSFLVSSLEESSFTDSLTFCKTSQIFENSLFEIQKNTGKASYMIVKLKNLSKINEELGHAAGDEYIKTTVNLLQISQSNTVFRLESSTFAFFLNDSDIENLEPIKKRIANACKDFSAMRSIPLELDISVELKTAVSG